MAETRKGDWIQTFTGRAFYPQDPRPDDVDPVDIAHALALINRYTGHTPVPYSVAQHSVFCCWLVIHKLAPGNLTAARWALMHDASEAYLTDISRPVKLFLPEYRDAEAKVTATIATRFGLPGPREPAIVKVADEVMLASEAELFFPLEKRPQNWGLRSAPDYSMLPVVVWDWREAERKFMQLTHDLELY